MYMCCLLYRHNTSGSWIRVHKSNSMHSISYQLSQKLPPLESFNIHYSEINETHSTNN